MPVEPGVVDAIVLVYAGDNVVAAHVPALVCLQCGEVWLEAEIGQLIDKVIQQHPQPKKYHQVPVFSLAEFTL
jgi:YgiT-type zinc finger domain-containing protein